MINCNQVTRDTLKDKQSIAAYMKARLNLKSAMTKAAADAFRRATAVLLTANYALPEYHADLISMAEQANDDAKRDKLIETYVAAAAALTNEVAVKKRTAHAFVQASKGLPNGYVYPENHDLLRARVDEAAEAEAAEAASAKAEKAAEAASAKATKEAEAASAKATKAAEVASAKAAKAALAEEAKAAKAALAEEAKAAKAARAAIALPVQYNSGDEGAIAVSPDHSEWVFRDIFHHTKRLTKNGKSGQSTSAPLANDSGSGAGVPPPDNDDDPMDGTGDPGVPPPDNDDDPMDGTGDPGVPPPDNDDDSMDGAGDAPPPETEDAPSLEMEDDLVDDTGGAVSVDNVEKKSTTQYSPAAVHKAMRRLATKYAAFGVDIWNADVEFTDLPKPWSNVGWFRSGQDSNMEQLTARLVLIQWAMGYEKHHPVDDVMSVFKVYASRLEHQNGTWNVWTWRGGLKDNNDVALIFKQHQLGTRHTWTSIHSENLYAFMLIVVSYNPVFNYWDTTKDVDRSLLAHKSHGLSKLDVNIIKHLAAWAEAYSSSNAEIAQTLQSKHADTVDKKEKEMKVSQCVMELLTALRPVGGEQMENELVTTAPYSQLTVQVAVYNLIELTNPKKTTSTSRVLDAMRKIVCDNLVVLCDGYTGTKLMDVLDIITTTSADHNLYLKADPRACFVELQELFWRVEAHGNGDSTNILSMSQLREFNDNFQDWKSRFRDVASDKDTEPMFGREWRF